VVKALRRKLLRDLWRLRYQCVTIALLVGCGIASFVAAVAASASMQASRDAFYASARFADVFDHLKGAPRMALDRLRELPGVAAVDGRVTGDFRVELEGSLEPAMLRFVSFRAAEPGPLNRPTVLEGRPIEPARSDEVVLSKSFAETWGLEPGSSITAVINGRRAKLRVVGIAVSPEFSIAVDPRTGLPDPRHFGVGWMDADALEKATDLVGAFNDVSMKLSAGADEQETIRRVDAILEPYGGLGAIGRADQTSAKLVEQKIDQLANLAKTLPVIFLGVAGFLLHVLLTRIVGTEREQIATLKALGYRSRELEAHYLGFAAAICALGVAFGIALGLLAAHALLLLYAQYFTFPTFLFRLNAAAIVAATLVAFAAGIGGTLRAVHKAVSIPAAEAMRPEAPPTYHETVLDRAYRVLPPVARMIVRDVQRRPVRVLLSAASIALATAIVLAGRVFGESINKVLRLEFEVAHREQISATLDRARPWRAVSDMAHLPGVEHAEGERVVPVRLREGPRFRTTAILGLPAHMDLFQLLGRDQRPLRLPERGLSLSRILAQRLGVRPGDEIEIDVLEGKRQKLQVRVARLVDDLVGMSAYMNARELARLLDEKREANVVLLATFSPNIDAVTERLNEVPAVASISRPDLDRSLVHSEVADAFTAMSTMLALFAAAIAVGVVYNNARIALEVRSRDLATMRILGFSRGEISAVLLGEQAIQVVLGVVPGLVLGRAMGALWLTSVDQELLRIPATLSAPSYVAAASVVLLAALVSALIVRRQSDRLDLVAVLKARD
jgi:putative ABC transport system permease protein